MSHPIAIVGISCRYPDARAPQELWENVLAGRKAFRAIPECRLPRDYHSTQRSDLDRTYLRQAALIEDYEFDRVGFSITKDAYRSADWVHWLALDMASRALRDAGYDDADGLPRQTTGVLMGNSLTGESSRANMMRLRWPYLSRTVDEELAEAGWEEERRNGFLQRLEQRFKAPFADMSEETLAGGLSNTVAGRICNHFDFKGGGYTVDGACASSLLALVQACTALDSGQLDFALAGGVDLSLDPFELVGFARVGALASGEMRVYDSRPTGFLPGEGCGMVALMRHQDALEQGRRIYASIAGWGVSSDGSGSITRPSVEGQMLALERAYRCAGFSIGSVHYFEGHGTGTAVGDATELESLTQARRASQVREPAVISSIKSNIGHTKAAAGVAGLIKTAMALYNNLLPPHVGCSEPHPLLTGEDAALRVLPQAQAWPNGGPPRAGVSAMGFGGINTHLALEGRPAAQSASLLPRPHRWSPSFQDCELFLLEADDIAELRAEVSDLAGLAPGLSRAEMGDLAAELAGRLGGGPVRAAVTADSPTALAEALKKLADHLEQDDPPEELSASGDFFLSRRQEPPRVGLLFPGQAAPAPAQGDIWSRRFGFLQPLYDHLNATSRERDDTGWAQPSIITSSVAGLLVLRRLGVRAEVALGHSLGELAALFWGGALNRRSVLEIARYRGELMASLDSPPGGMAAIRAKTEQVEALIEGTSAVISAWNSPVSTIISAPAEDLEQIMERARRKRIAASRLPVSHAFHSPLVEAAADPLRERLEEETLHPLRRTVFSTISGDRLTSRQDLRPLLHQQVTAPVRFSQALEKASAHADLWIEVGPGKILGGLAAAQLDQPVFSLDVASKSLSGLLRTAAALFVSGVPFLHHRLFQDRLTRPFDLKRPKAFLVNPCEKAVNGNRPLRSQPVPETVPQQAPASQPAAASPGEIVPAEQALDLVREMIAGRAELPQSAVQADRRLLSDLHLNSIAVGQIVTDAAARLGVEIPSAPTEYADATVQEVADSLAQRAQEGGSSEDVDLYEGVDAWVRSFHVELQPAELTPEPDRQSGTRGGKWMIFSHDGAGPLQLRQRLSQGCAAGGVLVYLEHEPDESQVELLLRAAEVLRPMDPRAAFVLVGESENGASFARTLHLETSRPTLVIRSSASGSETAERVAQEIRALGSGFREVAYQEDGSRNIPVLCTSTTAPSDGALPVGSPDLVLVTGGGKGITAECALALAEMSGCRLALLGRSDPETDTALQANLERFRDGGVDFGYFRCDVSQAAQVKQAVSRCHSEMGPVTGVLHGAGCNHPNLIQALRRGDFEESLAPKVHGLSYVLDAIDQDSLKLLVAFGSVIARTGLPGEAHYALANQRMTGLVEQFKERHPGCFCQSLEWSVWGGLGMGEQLNRIDSLIRSGVTPISVDQGVAAFKELLANPPSQTSLVVAGRLANTPTLSWKATEIPLLRFLDQVRVFVPGVELVADCELTADTDPYIQDHVFDGEMLFPAVMGLEAMAQAATVLLDEAPGLQFEAVDFHRPIRIPQDGSQAVRIAALRRRSGEVEVVLRSQETQFKVNHFKVLCRPRSAAPIEALPQAASPDSEPVKLEPQGDLYGNLLFHQGRFQRLSRYLRLHARDSIAQIDEPPSGEWFGHWMASELVLADAGCRDAAIHSIQACIPHKTVLPVGVERIESSLQPARFPLTVQARERSQEGPVYIYDMQLRGDDGVVLEKWSGLRLRVVGTSQIRWAAPLLGPYLERKVKEQIPDCSAALGSRLERARRKADSNPLIQSLLGGSDRIHRRPDGKPLGGSKQVSATHVNGLSMALAGPGPVACDAENVVARSPQQWTRMLGKEGWKLAEVISSQVREDPNLAATRVWTAKECLRKLGAVHTPLVLSRDDHDGWIVLGAGTHQVLSWSAHLPGKNEHLVFTFTGMDR
ncbi:MAG TPA: SDR family NAD(P)-dependent oxidoreductase [Acidobacteriota bacterium]|nr:SDR family NAD(P)-dependent oxidoreductase [Acidobacteriota bacterium]